MAQEYLSEASWKQIRKSFGLRDNGLEPALADYERIEETQYDRRLKAIVQVTTYAGKLRRKSEVTSVPDLAKYVAKVANAAEFERREILIAKDIATKLEEEKRLAREEQELDEEEDENPEAEEDYRRLSRDLATGLQRVLSGGGNTFRWISGKRDTTRRMPVSALMVAASIGSAHKALLTRVTGSRSFFEGTCMVEDGKITFVLPDTLDPIRFVTELRRSIQYFTGKKYAVRAKAGDGSIVRDEDPDEDRDGHLDDEEEEPDPRDPERLRRRPPGDLDPPSDPGIPLSAELRREAEVWNKGHVSHVVQFDRATGGRFAKRNGELDADGVARWQVEHHLFATGKVDDETVKLALQLSPGRMSAPRAPGPLERELEIGPMERGVALEVGNLQRWLVGATRKLGMSKAALADSYASALAEAKDPQADRTPAEARDLIGAVNAEYREALGQIKVFGETANRMARELARLKAQPEEDALRKLATQTVPLLESIVDSVEHAFRR